jgi:hypothetical protein
VIIRSKITIITILSSKTLLESFSVVWQLVSGFDMSRQASTSSNNEAPHFWQTWVFSGFDSPQIRTFGFTQLNTDYITVDSQI